MITIGHIHLFYYTYYIHILYLSIAGAAKAAVIDPKYEKYFKMIKMMPEEVVRHKMSAENLSQADIDEFFRQLLNSAVHLYDVYTVTGANISSQCVAAAVRLTYDWCFKGIHDYRVCTHYDYSIHIIIIHDKQATLPPPPNPLGTYPNREPTNGE